MKPKRGISKWAYWFSLGVAIIIVYKCINDFSGLYNFLKTLMGVIMPFLIAILIAYLFYRPVRFLENKLRNCHMPQKVARPLSVFILYILAVLLIILLINCVYPPIKDSILDLIANAPNYIEKIKEIIITADEGSILEYIDFEAITNKIKEIDFAALLSSERIVDYISKVIGVFSGIINVFVTIIVSIYLLLERGQIKEFLKKLGEAVFDAPTYTKMSKYVRESNRIFLDFIYCQVIDGFIIGILASIAMRIMGIKYSILLGCFIGLFNIIPYFGAIIAIAISVLITILTGGIKQAAIMAVVIIILQQIDSNIINPKILGDGLKISPILVIFAVTVGGEFFGVIGMFLGVPVIAILKLLVSDFIELRRKLKSYKKGIQKTEEETISNE